MYRVFCNIMAKLQGHVLQVIWRKSLFDTILKLLASEMRQHCCNFIEFLLVRCLGYWLWLCGSVIVVKMPKCFTDEEYSVMPFVYGFCNGNGRTAVAESWHLYTHHRTFEAIHRILLFFPVNKCRM